MTKDRGDREPRHARSWLPDLDFLTTFFSFWLGAAFEERLNEPVPVKVRSRNA